MKRHLPIYVLAAAVVLVGAVAFGVPTSGLWLGFVVLCPLMMIFMMGGMHGGDDRGRPGMGLTHPGRVSLTPGGERE